ncbi:unnamed protein product, partial [Allacma fusca]
NEEIFKEKRSFSSQKLEINKNSSIRISLTHKSQQKIGSS